MIHLASADGGLTTSLTAFLLVVVASFFLCLIVGTSYDTVSGFLTANRSLGALRNGIAMCGDYISVTALLVPVGTIALAGQDGIAFTTSTVAALIILLVLAEPVRNTGAFTLGGILTTRVPGRQVRIAAAVVTLMVCVPLTVVQLKVAGDAMTYLLGLDDAGAGQVCIVLLGLLIVSFSAFGGMSGTSMIEIAKVILAFGTFVTATAVILNRFHFDLGALLAAAAKGSGRGEDYFAPGQLYGPTATGTAERFSVALTLALGSGILPPVLMRINASRTGRTARRSARHAVLAFAAFSLALTVLGLGAAALVGTPAIVARGGQGYAALFLLSESIAGGHGGGTFFTLFACAVFVTALGAVSGLTLSAAASLAHDLRTPHDGTTTRDEKQVTQTRWWLAVVGIVSVVLAVLVYRWSILFFASYAAALAASTILPALIYALFWRGLTRNGLLATLYGGAAACMLLQVFSPTVSGSPAALFPGQDFHWFPLENVALLSVPVGFLAGWIMSRFDRRPPAQYATPQNRMLTGKAPTSETRGRPQ
ncbi:cation acetate symporter [Streptomyces sp. NPDC048297]|uniref:sodium/solute symporter n=1 Tax=Streptomyces sp. NPDC048297 TaxID=3365531 RepID=UPI0037102B70